MTEPKKSAYFLLMTEKELGALLRARRRDRVQSRTRRRRAVESLPERLSSALDTYFSDDPTALRSLEEHRALAAWPELVGEAAALVSFAKRVRGRQLVVLVPDPLWRQQLFFLKEDLLKKYQAAFPRLKIEEIFYVGR